MIEALAEKIITFKRRRFQKSYALGLGTYSVRNFSAIFQVNRMRTPADMTSRVKVLVPRIVGMILARWKLTFPWSSFLTAFLVGFRVDVLAFFIVWRASCVEEEGGEESFLCVRGRLFPKKVSAWDVGS